MDLITHPLNSIWTKERLEKCVLELSKPEKQKRKIYVCPFGMKCDECEYLKNTEKEKICLFYNTKIK